MDEIKFKNEHGNFPLSTDSLELLQEMVRMIARLACPIGGNWWIVQGCTRTGDKISSGIVCYEDELLPFEGGDYTTHVKLVKTSEDITVSGKIYKDARVRYKLVGTNETAINCTPWSRFKSRSEVVNPVSRGMVVDFTRSANEIPDGWELYGDASASPLRIIKK